MGNHARPGSSSLRKSLRRPRIRSASYAMPAVNGPAAQAREKRLREKPETVERRSARVLATPQISTAASAQPRSVEDSAWIDAWLDKAPFSHVQGTEQWPSPEIQAIALADGMEGPHACSDPWG